MKSLLCVLFLFGFGLSGLRGEDGKPVGELPSTERLPGVDLAQGITQITGVAISPLLGVSAVGAWQYFQTPAVHRHLLPWFTRPYVWGAGLCLIALCLLKDVFGAAAPPLLKKPFDVAELFEDKLSALVACSAFLPFVVMQMSRYQAPLGAVSAPSGMLLASSFAIAGIDVRWLLIPFAVFIFLTVWLTCHAINVLIALCPFGFVDGFLKLFKGLLLSLVVLAAFINPYVGVVVSLGIIFVASLLAPWAFRLTVFGTLFGLDILWPRYGRKAVRVANPHAFLARPLASTPVRTYGSLTRSVDGVVAFTYRPWLIFPRRSVALPEGEIALARGVFFPSVLHRPDVEKRLRMIVLFLPRYRSHERSMADYFEIADVLDSPIIKGYRAIRGWFADTLHFGKAKYMELAGKPTT